MKIIGIVTNGNIEVLNMTMALFGFQIVRSTAVGEVGTIRATGYPGTQE